MENMEYPEKIVDFEKYCKTCIHKDCNDVKGEEPCCSCLGETTNTNSKKPIYYKEDEKLVEKENKEKKEIQK